MNKKIYLSPPHMSGNEMKYIQQAFATNWSSTLSRTNEILIAIKSPYRNKFGTGYFFQKLHNVATTNK